MEGSEQQVRIVHLTGPVARYGFTGVGEQWDEEDGLEISYEIHA
jgi:hypothetical protein